MAHMLSSNMRWPRTSALLAQLTARLVWGQKTMEQVLAEQQNEAHELHRLQQLCTSQSQHLLKEKATSLRWHKHAGALALKCFRSRAAAVCSTAFA